MTIGSNANLQKAYTEEKARAIALLEKITTAVNAEPEVAPNWGYWGSMEYMTSQLQEISDALHKEGEHAQ